MVARVVLSAVLVVVTTVTLTGCGRQVSRGSSQTLDLPATGPDPQTLPTPRPAVSAALEATGGLVVWEQCRRIDFRGIVTACDQAGWSYLTEQEFVVYPWSNAIQITAHEPRANFLWQVVGGQYHGSQTDPNLDVSPLARMRGDYAEAVLQIATAPVRLLMDGAGLTKRPALAQITGQWYLPIDAKYPTEQAARVSHWTQGTYFQSQDGSLVDMIWLGDPAAHKYLIVRGYDYAQGADSGVRIPTKIEIFQSDGEANIGSRLARIDLHQ